MEASGPPVARSLAFGASWRSSIGCRKRRVLLTAAKFLPFRATFAREVGTKLESQPLTLCDRGVSLSISRASKAEPAVRHP
jgi:hypothetical protein